jgi:peptidoglycan hydrolase-like protein with peptidoglycan-binding domain
VGHETYQIFRHPEIDRRRFAMQTSRVYRLLLALSCLILWPVLTGASTDWRIGQAQERLKAAGFDPGYVDGVLGARTREALRRYQASRGLPVTGALDDATRQVLLAGDRSRTGGTPIPESWLKTPPGGDYKKLSSLAQLPDNFPGLGTLYVNPVALPAGPFLAYDRNGNLVSSVYMIPLKDLRAGKAFNGLDSAPGKVDHVDIYYNNGHPGVPDPHYHIVLWYITPAQVEALQ